ncbi:Collectin-12 [Holothuria leucospilota]|uniref:Collectin-12 n=1 Tax=Holothuria leucospilota TaxID=206669 RepID=A0A9Q0Y9N3_HOLLE|nr:Collectin-12 [Holothuria leucospilota]
MRRSLSAKVLDVRSLWIRLNDPQKDQRFKWVDGSWVSYTNWNIGEPNNYNNNGEYYVLIRNDGTWNDFPESGRAPFICKMPRRCECFFI